MSIIWPVGLPQAPQTASYSQEDTDRALRSSMQGGPAKVRLGSLAVIENCTIELKLTRTQLALLKTFHRGSTAGGTLAFTWKHHETGNPIDYRFTGPVSSAPRAPRQSGTEYWVATFNLETVPGTEVTSEPPEEAPVNRAGGGAGVGGDPEGTFAPETFLGERTPDHESQEAIVGFLPMEADTPEPDIVIQLLSGFGSGFDEDPEACTCGSEPVDPDSLLVATSSGTPVNSLPAGGGGES